MHINKNDKARIVTEMADYMLVNPDHCTRETLLLQFSQVEVDTCSEAARQKAQARLALKAA